MYDRIIDNEPFHFSNTSALYESDMVMVDHHSGSYWMQVSGEAIVGPLTGKQLTALPSQTTTWKAWRELYPDSIVLSRETGYSRNYTYDPFLQLGEQLNETGEFIFPVSENGRDPRLQPGEVVLGLEWEGEQWAYPIERLGDAVVMDELTDGTTVVIFSNAEGPNATAFLNILDDGEALEFSFTENGYQDSQTSSTWNLAGVAIAGPLEGTRLTPLPTRSTFWFSLISSFPDLNFWEPE